VSAREPIAAELPDKSFYRIDEVAEILGVSDNSIANWIRQGRLRAVRMGTKLVRIPRAELRRFLTASEIQAPETEEADGWPGPAGDGGRTRTARQFGGGD
jgi:excisionase family DNA binding protein